MTNKLREKQSVMVIPLRGWWTNNKKKKEETYIETREYNRMLCLFIWADMYITVFTVGCPIQKENWLDFV